MDPVPSARGTLNAYPKPKNQPSSNDAINVLEEKPYPLISIHGAIATTREDVDDAVTAMATASLRLDWSHDWRRRC